MSKQQASSVLHLSPRKFNKFNKFNKFGTFDAGPAARTAVVGKRHRQARECTSYVPLSVGPGEGGDAGEWPVLAFINWIPDEKEAIPACRAGRAARISREENLMAAMIEHVTVTAPDISCGHCVATVKGAVGALAGVASVEADADTKRVEIDFDPGRVSLAQIEAALDEAGYPVQK